MTPPTTDGVSPLHQIVGNISKRRRITRESHAVRLSPPKSRNWIRRATPALFARVSRCAGLCQEQRGQTPAGLFRQIWAGFQRLTGDEKESRIKNRRQVWRSVRSLLPAVRAVTGVFGEFQSGVKIEGVISLLRSSSPRAYSRKKKVGGMPRKRCYREQKRHLPLCRTPERKMSFFADEHTQKLRRKTKNKPRLSSKPN